MEKIILYSTGCPKCEILEKKLKTKGLSYTTENSVDKMLELGIAQVPVLSIEGELLAFKQANDWINQQ